MRAPMLSTLILAAFMRPDVSGAQSVEIGPSLAAGCRGSEGSSCGNGSSTLWGGYLSVIYGDRFEGGMWAATMSSDDRAVTLGSRSSPIEIATTDRSRTFTMSQILYHFKRGEQIRPLIGVAFGTFVDGWTTTCRPAACEALRPGGIVVQAGQVTNRHSDVALIVGLSVRASDRWRMRVGARLHNFPAESLSTTEAFVQAGYRFTLNR